MCGAPKWKHSHGKDFDKDAVLGSHFNVLSQTEIYVYVLSVHVNHRLKTA